MPRVLTQHPREPYHFLFDGPNSSKPSSVNYGTLAGGQGILEDGQVLERHDNGKLYAATGHDHRVEGVLIEDRDTTAGDIPIIFVGQVATVALELIVLPEDSTEGTTIVGLEGLTEREVIFLMLFIRRGIQVCRLNTPGTDLAGEIPNWQSYLPARRWL